MLLATLSRLVALLERTSVLVCRGGGDAGSMSAIETRPAIRDTRCCDERRRERPCKEAREDVCDLDRDGLLDTGELGMLIGVRGLDEMGDWAGEKDSGSGNIVRPEAMIDSVFELEGTIVEVEELECTDLVGPITLQLRR